MRPLKWNFLWASCWSGEAGDLGTPQTFRHGVEAISKCYVLTNAICYPQMGAFERLQLLVTPPVQDRRITRPAETVRTVNLLPPSCGADHG